MEKATTKVECICTNPENGVYVVIKAGSLVQGNCSYDFACGFVAGWNARDDAEREQLAKERDK